MSQPVDVLLLHLDGKIVPIHSSSCDELYFLRPTSESIDERCVMDAIERDSIMQRQFEPLEIRKITSKIHMLAIPKELLSSVSDSSKFGRLLLDSASYSRFAIRGQSCYQVAVSIDPEIRDILYVIVKEEFLEQTKKLEKQNKSLEKQNKSLDHKLRLEETTRKKAEELLAANLAEKQQFMCLPLWRKVWRVLTKGCAYE
jgi:hypothetical protein